MDLLKDLKLSLLNFSFIMIYTIHKILSFIMIYTIHKILVWIKNDLNYCKDNIFEYFLRSIIYFLFFFK